ncbi:DUF4349 domain-containing protein [Bacillus haimaensis]|uniref:DUF4349 domain-containing protein n=1 Tax=Bacillus haimaensis TaxID=3160967 RepID=UPI003AA9C51C
MGKRILIGFAFILLLLTGCSASNDSSDSSNAMDSSEQKSYEGGIGADMDDSAGVEEDGEMAPEGVNNERKVMYNASVSLEVDDIGKSIDEVEKNVRDLNGYVVEVNFTSNNEQDYGSITLRIPTDSLTAFLDGLEEFSGKVVEKRVVGQDVTEEYVDLTSRLKAKRVVEERLLDLLSKAEKTEDLLKISNDLSIVQEEIEQVMGRMKYLDNKTEFAEVEMNFMDVSIPIPDVKGNEDLKTGEKIKKTFAASLNSITAFFSGLAVFLIGYSPILLLLAAASFIIYIGVRRYYKKRESKSE